MLIKLKTVLLVVSFAFNGLVIFTMIVTAGSVKSKHGIAYLPRYGRRLFGRCHSCCNAHIISGV